MKENDWVLAAEVTGELEAVLIRSMLEAQGIPVTLFQESAARAIGIQISTLGNAQIFVPANEKDRASELLNSYFYGDRPNETDPPE
jgi:hypothetical protein